jgi:hypothetical protein
MITLQMLEDHDTILPTDWCRPLLLLTMSGGRSDDYSFTSMYTGQPENNVTWVTADQILGEGWMGETVGAYNAAVNHCGPSYEFVRGEIPATHQYGKTARQLLEDHNAWLQANRARVGKYKGQSWKTIEDLDHDYFQWAKATIMEAP